jgi:hypothetical protein
MPSPGNVTIVLFAIISQYKHIKVEIPTRCKNSQNLSGHETYYKFDTLIMKIKNKV